MANYQNHVVDPTWFYDAIELFAFDYDAYIITNKEVNDMGEEVYTYEKQTVRGSLQTQGRRLEFSMTGNTTNLEYKFYCKSLYRLNEGDFIYYKKLLLQVNEVHEYDEYGVRESTLKLVQLTSYRDLEEYMKYINGDIIV